MNSIFLLLLIFVSFSVAYLLYGRLLSKLFGVKKDRKTPAFTEYDGIDYVPVKHWTVLFGHHFASIAGAAPIVGPVIAASIWGWAPSIIWIVLGTIFLGGIHDYGALMISIKHKGASIADIAEHAISKKAKLIFLIFVWLTLILVISVFVYLSAKTFVVSPKIVVPSLGLIPLAIFVGVLIYRLKVNQVLSTVIGLLILLGLIIAGNYFPISLSVGNAIKFWSVLLLIYSFFASITPVNILLQPRDYLASFLLFFGLLFGFVGLFLNAPKIALPAWSNFTSGEFLPAWPVLFVTIACGAISGFHSLVASGTTSKQLKSEGDAKKIGYGGMIGEGLLASLTVILIACYFKDQSSLSAIVNSGKGPIEAFSMAYGSFTKKILGSYGGLFAIIVLNAFILTSLDTATRIARYLTQELFKIKNRYSATLLVVAVSGWLGLSGEWNEIWPIFGSANQLIAALALIVITNWLLSRRKRVLYTLLPMIFMLFTTVAALILKIIEYVKLGEVLLLAISSILLCLAFFVCFEAIIETRRIMRKRLHLKI